MTEYESLASSLTSQIRHSANEARAEVNALASQVSEETESGSAGGGGSGGLFAVDPTRADLPERVAFGMYPMFTSSGGAKSSLAMFIPSGCVIYDGSAVSDLRFNGESISGDSAGDSAGGSARDRGMFELPESGYVTCNLYRVEGSGSASYYADITTGGGQEGESGAALLGRVPIAKVSRDEFDATFSYHVGAVIFGGGGPRQIYGNAAEEGKDLAVTLYPGAAIRFQSADDSHVDIQAEADSSGNQVVITLGAYWM